MTAEGFDYLLVMLKAHLYFDDLVGRRLLYLLPHFVGIAVVADGEGGVGAVVGIESPDFIPWLTHYFAREVVEGDVDGSLGGTVVGRDALHVLVDVLDAEGVGELAQVELRQELGHRCHRFSQVGWHRRFAVSGDAVVFDLNLHAGRGGALRPCQVEGMAQLELVGAEAQV